MISQDKEKVIFKYFGEAAPVDYPFASRHEGPRFNPQRGIYVNPGFSYYRCLATLVTPT
jgi:hypothetical protein